MTLNANEIALILSELDIKGSFIQEITQSTYDTLSFKIVGAHEPYYLMICTANNALCLYKTARRPPKSERPLRFGEFLKKNVQGMRVNECRELGLDRIVFLDVSTWKRKLFVYIRLWTGAANVIVTDEGGAILDCMYRRPKRGEVTGGTFIPDKGAASEEDIAKAKEKYPVRARKAEYKSFNEQIEALAKEGDGALSKDELLEQLKKRYERKREKMSAALKRLRAKEETFKGAAELKHKGDLILTYAGDCKGDALECVDYETGETVRIELDPALTPEQNAQSYYERYKRDSSALPDLKRDIERSERALEALDAHYKPVLAEENPLKLKQALEKEDAQVRQKPKPYAGLRYEVDGWTILVGRSAAENDELLRRAVKGRDLWLHTRDFPGGYVFIKAQKGKSVSRDAFLCAQNLALYHSKARKNGKADLYCTEVRYLRRVKNGPRGLVIPTQEKNIYVTFDRQYLDKAGDTEAYT